MTITVGKYTYFPDAPWLLNQQGAITPTSCSVSAYVPVDAVRYAIQCVLFRPILPQSPPHNGYCDSSVAIRLPGYTDKNYALIALKAAMLQSGGYVEDGGMGELSIPNIGREFYWLMNGSTLNYGCTVSIALLWYESP